MGNTTLSSRKTCRLLILVTPCITQEHPQARTQTMLLHHLSNQEEAHLGLLGNELHLGQKPKLGGRYTDIIHLYTHHIRSALCISIFCFFCLFFSCCFILVVSVLISFGGCYYSSNLYFHFQLRLCTKDSL